MMVEAGWLLGEREVYRPRRQAPGASSTLSSADVMLPRAAQADEVVHWRADGGEWESITNRLERLGQLPYDWDAEGGIRVQPDVVGFSLALLEEVLDPYVSAPSLIPTHEGALALEWHTPVRSLEVEVFGSGDGSVYFRDRDSGEEWELRLAAVRGNLRRLLETHFPNP